MPRNWSFTINNPLKEDDDNLYLLVCDKKFQFSVWSLEKGDSEGTLHVQGYVQLNDNVRLAWMKKMLPRAHLEPSKGSPEQNIVYCSKSDTHLEGPFIYGEPKQQGKRNDIVEFKDDIKKGETNLFLIDNHTLNTAKYPKFINFVRSETVYKDKAQTIMTEGRIVEIIWGKPGIGKSRSVYERFGFENVYTPLIAEPSKTLWFENYQGQECILIEDFYSWLPYDFLLRFTDRYPLLLQTKGGSIMLCSKYIIFTSNEDPKGWYPNIKDKTAFMRRVSKVIAM